MKYCEFPCYKQGCKCINCNYRLFKTMKPPVYMECTLNTYQPPMVEDDEGEIEAGDWLAILLSRIGITKRRVNNFLVWIGWRSGCGCQGRQENINRFHQVLKTLWRRFNAAYLGASKDAK